MLRLEQLREMLSKEPEDLFLNYALAIELASNSAGVQDAVSQLHKVLKLDATYIPAYYQLGRLHEIQGNNTEALDYYRKGLSLAEIKKDRKTAGEFREAIFMLED